MSDFMLNILDKQTHTHTDDYQRLIADETR